MSQLNSKHILAAALALVESKLKEALEELDSTNQVNAAQVSALVEAIVDRKMTENSVDQKFDDLTQGVYEKVDTTLAFVKSHVDQTQKITESYIDNSVATIDDKLTAHNHNSDYSHINHNHDGVYAFQTDQKALEAKTKQHLTNLANATLEGHQSLSDAFKQHSDDVAKKFVEQSDDQGKKLEAAITSVSGVIDGLSDKQDKRHTAVTEAIGMVGDAHDALRTDFEKFGNKVNTSIAKKADAGHTHDYAPSKHEHDYAPSEHEHDNYLTHEHMIALNGQLSAIDMAHTQNSEKIWQSLNDKANANEIITQSDLEALKSEMTKSIQSSIQMPKDALGWDFKPHPNKQGVIMYKRDDWKQWKQITLFNQNLFNEVNNALNRAYMPQQGFQGYIGGASYQDPKELVGYTKLDDHRDVDLSIPPAANDLLVWNAATNQWVARTVQEFASLLLPILEADLNAQYNKLIDVVGNFTYVGEALPGTATSVAQWRIKRVEDLGNGDMSILWSNASADFAYKWDDRLTLNYSI